MWRTIINIFFLVWVCQERIMEQLGISDYFTPIKCLKSIRRRFPEGFANFYSVMSREIIGKHALLVCRHCLLWGSCALTWWRFKQSNKMCRYSRKKTKVKITYPGQRFKIPSLSHHSLLSLPNNCLWGWRENSVPSLLRTRNLAWNVTIVLTF